MTAQNGKYDFEMVRQDDDGSSHRSKGLGVLMTALFIVGYQIGGGIVMMPKAMVNANWGGLAIILIGGLASTYAAVELGTCWTLVQKRWPQYRSHTRKPYAVICDRALGAWAKHLASVSVVVTMFGISIIYLLLAAENIVHLLKVWEVPSALTFCHMVLILAAILTPPSFLGSPKDFWPVAVVSMGTSLLACFCIIGGAILDAYPSPIPNSSADNSSAISAIPDGFVSYNSTAVVPAHFPHAYYPLPTFVSFALSYGAITFAYGGHSAFPTFQNDMKNPHEFWKAATLASSVVVALYVPVGLSGFLVYGETVQNNIVLNIGTPWINVSLSLMLTIHLIVSFLIALNPPCQEIEEALRIPHSFNWKRVVVRIALVLAAVFIAESVPSFGLILDLVGATTMTLNAFVLPGACLLALKLQQPPQDQLLTEKSFANGGAIHGYDQNEKDERRPALWEWLVNVAIAVVGITGGVAGTYAAIHGLFTHEFGTPCYMPGDGSCNSTTPMTLPAGGHH